MVVNARNRLRATMSPPGGTDNGCGEGFFKGWEAITLLCELRSKNMDRVRESGTPLARTRMRDEKIR